MCTICGCGTAAVGAATEPHSHHHHHHDGHDHPHRHGHGPLHQHDGDHVDVGPAAPPPAGVERRDIVRLERDLLAENDAHARDNRRRLAAAGCFALNLVSSPGSGKTTLLCRTIEALKERLPSASYANPRRLRTPTR